MGMPRDLDEAARLDGCNSFGILVRILLPSMKPVLVTLFIFSLTGIWGDYLGPEIYLRKQELHTLALSLKYFKDVHGFVDWKLTMAGCIMFALPMIVVLFVAQKAFTQGIIMSGMK
jgi:multiple sugar transport system permease protein